MRDGGVVLYCLYNEAFFMTTYLQNYLGLWFNARDSGFRVLHNLRYFRSPARLPDRTSTSIAPNFPFSVPTLEGRGLYIVQGSGLESRSIVSNPINHRNT
jgi:hypothetical protein